jgi:AcrR family transcriptional regulator
MARPADPNARASLLSAARAEFVKKGIRGARIEDITAACGLSKGAFYLHFESKEALFAEAMGTFKGQLDAMADERRGVMQDFFAEHGRPDLQDAATRSERYRRLVQLEMEQDLRMLELMWANRDVLDVLIRGSQGTEFESFIWSMADREVERVARDCQQLLADRGPGEDEIEPELFGSLVVGAYLLLCKRMIGMKEKPDLAVWARSLQHLFREGSMPRPLPSEARKPAASKPSPRRPSGARATTRRTPRSSP